MKKITLFLIFALMGTILNAQNVHIPDLNFKAQLVGISSLNTNGDTEIQVSEANDYTGTINVSNSNISDLTGIEAFTSITYLSCAHNQLTSLDVSQNLALSQLICNNNNISSLDVSLNTSLTELNCDSNQLTLLNVANGNNGHMYTLTATNNPNLTCIQHDSGFNTGLATFWTKDGTASWSDNCNYPCTEFVNIQDINFLDALLAHGTTIGGVSVIDTDGDGQICVAEAEAYTGKLRLSDRNISDLTGIEAFTSLTELNCSGNSLTSLNLSQNTALTNITCFGNQLTSLDVSQNTALRILICANNQLTNLDLSKNTLLRILSCFDNKLTHLDVSENTALESVICIDNQLTSLNVANGNNANMTMNATNNSNLRCIQHDTGFDPTSSADWQKDATASWNKDCANSGGGATSIVSENNIVFSIFPNPTTGIVQIATEEEINSIEVYSLTGQKVATFRTKEFSIENLEKGIYFLEIINSNKKSVTRIYKL